MTTKRKAPCTNAGHNIGEAPCPACGCSWAAPCFVLGCPHCDRALTAEGKRLTRTARALAAAEATALRWEKKSSLALSRLLKVRAEVTRLRARLARLETPDDEGKAE